MEGLINLNPTKGKNYEQNQIPKAVRNQEPVIGRGRDYEIKKAKAEIYSSLRFFKRIA